MSASDRHCSPDDQVWYGNVCYITMSACLYLDQDGTLLDQVHYVCYIYIMSVPGPRCVA